MSIKRIFSLVLALLIFSIYFTGTSCKSRKAGCEANGQYQTKKLKKNKSRYGIKYNYKAKPVKKPYVIRNKSR